MTITKGSLTEEYSNFNGTEWGQIISTSGLKSSIETNKRTEKGLVKTITSSGFDRIKSYDTHDRHKSTTIKDKNGVIIATMLPKKNIFGKVTRYEYANSKGEKISSEDYDKLLESKSEQAK